MSDLPRSYIRLGPVVVRCDIITPMIMSNVRLELASEHDLYPEVVFVPYSDEAAEFIHVLNHFDDFPARKMREPHEREVYRFGPLEIHVKDSEFVTANYIGGEPHQVFFENGESDGKLFVEYLSRYEDDLGSGINYDYEIPYAISLANDIKNRYEERDRFDREQSDAEYSAMTRPIYIVLTALLILFILSLLI